MGDERLHHLAVAAYYYSITNELDLDELVMEFAKKGSRKIKLI
jgi:hypothetical protein